MALGGLLLEDLDDQQRKDRGIESDALALRAKHVGEYGEHAVAKSAGFRKEDVIIAFDGKMERKSETDLIAAALQHEPGEKLAVTVLRGKERLELKLPVQ